MFLWLLQITITLIESALLISFGIRGWKIAGMGGRGLNYWWVQAKNFQPGSGRINFLWLGLDRVSHLWFAFEFGKFPPKNVNFSIFTLWVKKISSGRVRKYPGWRRVGLLFTTGQK